MSGQPSVEFLASGDGEKAYGFAVARGKVAYLVFYLAAAPDAQEAATFTSSFVLE